VGFEDLVSKMNEKNQFEKVCVDQGVIDLAMLRIRFSTLQDCCFYLVKDLIQALHLMIG